MKIFSSYNEVRLFPPSLSHGSKKEKEGRQEDEGQEDQVKVEEEQALNFKKTRRQPQRVFLLCIYAAAISTVSGMCSSV